MNGKEIWVWFVAGFIPYHIERETETNGRRVLRITALFWSFLAHSHCDKRRQWIVRIPLIERLRSVVWAIITQLQKDIPPQA